MTFQYYPVLTAVSRGYPRQEGTFRCLTTPFAAPPGPKPLVARLACLIHATNVHSEPGSNPSIEFNGLHRKRQHHKGIRPRSHRPHLKQSNCLITPTHNETFASSPTTLSHCRHANAFSRKNFSPTRLPKIPPAPRNQPPCSAKTLPQNKNDMSKRTGQPHCM